MSPSLLFPLSGFRSDSSFLKQSWRRWDVISARYDDLVVSLLWTASHKLDYVGLNTSPQSQLTVNIVLPMLALHSQLGNVTSKLLCDDEESVELVNGQYVTLAFRLANNEQGTARDFIFFSNGYYYTIVP